LSTVHDTSFNIFAATLHIGDRSWEDNIKMDLQEVGCGGMDWIGLDKDRDRWWAILNAVMNLQVP
jgi:hypothetical protein